MIHGDIKPANIFMRSCNVGLTPYCPVIGDWDLAANYKQRLIPEIWARYTPGYRAPEMLYFGYDTYKKNLVTGPTGYKYSGKEDIFALVR